MAYDDDFIEDTKSREGMVSEDACKYLIVVITILMLLLALPSMISQTYENPLPGILALGLTALILSILYLASKLEKASDSPLPET